MAETRYPKEKTEFGAGGGGGGAPFQGGLSRPGSPFKLETRQAPPEPRNAKGLIEIWSGKQGKKVSEAQTMSGARKAIDRRDAAYGAADHYIKRKYED